jgi:hypothetical protein
MTNTLAYYERHAARYVQMTVDVDMSDLHARFLKHVPEGGLISMRAADPAATAKYFSTRAIAYVPSTPLPKWRGWPRSI